MAIITAPASLALGPDCTIGDIRSDRIGGSDPSGWEQAAIYGPPRWTQTLVSPQSTSASDAAAWRSMLLGLRGHTNRLAMHPAAHPYPRGTMRGTMTLAAPIAAGANIASITAGSGQAARTLLDDDWLQIGVGLGTSQLIRINADAISNDLGVITITFNHVARLAFAANAAVTWSRPLGYWVRTESDASWGYVGRRGGQHQIDLVEAFR